MRLEKASHKAIKYACLNFHYASRVPSGANVGYSVFNNENKFCGVVVYGYPASPNILPQFNLNNGQFLELRRVALNGMQSFTSKVVSISLRLLRKDVPNCKVVVSYADKGQNHLGIIYQATNFYFIEESKSSGYEYFINGKWVHSRHGKSKIKRKLAGKRKYIYPLSKELIPLCKELSKPYPKKNAQEV